MKTRSVLMALAAGVMFLGTSMPAEAQDCLCGTFGTCGAGPWTPITNLEDPKPPDCILCASDAFPTSCHDNWQGHKFADVSTVAQAITEIEACYTQNGDSPVNILVQGHGTSGVQCFGPGDECIGNNVPFSDHKDKFIAALSGKIKTLTFLGCSTAAEPKGQALLQKLAKELKAQQVKGWTGTNRVLSAKGGYETEGDKKEKDIPTVSEWGMVVMCLLVLTAGTVVVMRRRAMVMA